MEENKILQKLSEIDDKLGHMATKDEVEEKTNDILEFLQEHMVMREEFVDFKQTVALKSDLVEFATKDDLLRFATKEDLQGLENKLMMRFSEFQKELEDIKTRLERIEVRLKEDTDALVEEVEKLKQRVALLEKQLGSERSQFRA